MNPLCRYCSQPSEIDSTEYDRTYYKCNCEGYKREQQLTNEIRDLEYRLNKKREELSTHKSSSKYNKIIGELEKQFREIKYQYREY